MTNITATHFQRSLLFCPIILSLLHENWKPLLLDTLKFRSHKILRIEWPDNQSFGVKPSTEHRNKVYKYFGITQLSLVAGTVEGVQGAAIWRHFVRSKGST